jgi:hypothetical protein
VVNLPVIGMGEINRRIRERLVEWHSGSCVDKWN